MDGNESKKSNGSDPDASENDNHHDTQEKALTRSIAQEELEDEWKRLASRESKLVAMARVIVFLALVFATTYVTIGIRTYIQSDQGGDFETAFLAAADKILESFHNSVKRRLEAVDALSVSITSHVMATQQEFPFVNLPDYEIRAANARILSESYVINYFPLVREALRTEWNEWTQSSELASIYQKAFIADETMRKEQDERFQTIGKVDQVFDVNQTVYPLQQGEADLFLPGYQFSPVTPNILAYVNFDGYNSPVAKGVYKATVQTGLATLGMADLEFKLEGLREYLTWVYSLSQYRDRVEEVAFDPTSALSYPVFNSFDIDSRNVVGALGLNINWRTIFTRVLPMNIRGVHCVIENTFNQTFTIQVDGADATYLGVGDFHESAYSPLVQTAGMNEYLERTSSKETRAYTSVNLDPNFGNFRLRVYPSAATENDFRNNDPNLFTLVIIGVFLFTSLVFVAYDYIVARRLRTINRQAIKSSAIVSSLFPAQFRGQLYQDDDEEKPMTWYNTDASTRFVESASSERKHIASKFENTTVMFADLAGFTKWSSSRNPEAVFDLLEALYRKFDAAAKRRGVFKVETIGDCYLAVTGLPEPQAGHAVICARFAQTCIHLTRNVTQSLMATFGEDTADLQLRVGLHSGSVTAGVLRSDRARFQLFGATVNTASRMESTGRPGRIHASEQTVAELLAQGKERWIKPREDHVVAKGLGELSTYWIEIPTGSHMGSVATAESSQKGEDLDFEEGERTSLGHALLQGLGSMQSGPSDTCSQKSEGLSLHC